MIRLVEHRTASAAPRAAVPSFPDGSVDLSFVFVTYGTGPIVVDAIAALVSSLAETDHRYDVVVVDNAHDAYPTRSRNELALATSGVRLLTTGRNLGFAGGCELGALYAAGRVLVFVNPDLVVSAGWIDPLLARLAAGASIVAPVLLNDDGSVQEAGSRLWADGSTSQIAELLPDSPIVPDYASAACWLVTRDEHERLGGFDPGFHPAYYEDVDLALRTRAAGGRFEVATEVSVVHHHGQGTGDAVAPDTSEQRDRLLDRHPSIRWMQPARPDAIR